MLLFSQVTIALSLLIGVAYSACLLHPRPKKAALQINLQERFVMQERLGPCGTVPTYVVFSGADENVPPSVNKTQLVDRFKQALGPQSRSIIIDGATHELDGHAQQFTQLVEAFLTNITASFSN